MRRNAVIVLYILAMVGIIVGVDILFLRHLAWERLIVNVAIVGVFGVFYLRVLKRSV
jgi:cytochrome c oxidase subunit IV